MNVNYLFVIHISPHGFEMAIYLNE